MRPVLALIAILCLIMGLIIMPEAMAQTSPREQFRTYTGSISTSNAAVTSLIAAGDRLVVRSLQVSSSQAGTLTFTDGSSGEALYCLYVAANVRVDVPPAQIGPQGIKLTRGNELYVNALSSATISLAMSTGLE